MSALQHRPEGKQRSKAAYDPLSVLDENGEAEPLDDQGRSREDYLEFDVLMPDNLYRTRSNHQSTARGQ
jgi:hypothetical protein